MNDSTRFKKRHQDTNKPVICMKVHDHNLHLISHGDILRHCGATMIFLVILEVHGWHLLSYWMWHFNFLCEHFQAVHTYRPFVSSTHLSADTFSVLSSKIIQLSQSLGLVHHAASAVSLLKCLQWFKLLALILHHHDHLILINAFFITLVFSGFTVDWNNLFLYSHHHLNQIFII